MSQVCFQSNANLWLLKKYLRLYKPRNLSQNGTDIHEKQLTIKSICNKKTKTELLIDG